MTSSASNSCSSSLPAPNAIKSCSLPSSSSTVSSRANPAARSRWTMKCAVLTVGGAEIARPGVRLARNAPADCELAALGTIIARCGRRDCRRGSYCGPDGLATTAAERGRGLVLKAAIRTRRRECSTPPGAEAPGRGLFWRYNLGSDLVPRAREAIRCDDDRKLMSLEARRHSECLSGRRPAHHVSE